MMPSFRSLWSLLALLPLLALGCQSPAPEDTDAPATADANPIVARAQLAPTEGSEVSGTVTFTETDGAVRVEAVVNNLAPGPHGFHVHETGDCSAPDASSAGGHFNPAGTPHGGPEDPASERHVGDLGNIVADSTGMATYSRVDSVLVLQGDGSILGKGFIVHAGEDDLTSQPAGAAGARMACGVIEQISGPGMPDAAGDPTM